MKVTNLSSPNFDSRNNTQIDTIILHYTDTQNAKEALDILLSPERKVSSHYLVDENGEIFKLVEEENRAWHAGVSSWQGRERVNFFSIGIEIVNPGHIHGLKKFPDAQMQAVLELCKDIMQRHDIKSQNVLAHSDIAPGRKKDPGEMFDWQFLAKNGVGIFYQPKSIENKVLAKEGEKCENIKEIQQKLQKFGYKIEISGVFDEPTKHVVEAFQRHFLPFNSKTSRDITGKWGKIEEEIINGLLSLLT